MYAFWCRFQNVEVCWSEFCSDGNNHTASRNFVRVEKWEIKNHNENCNFRFSLWLYQSEIGTKKQLVPIKVN